MTTLDMTSPGRKTALALVLASLAFGTTAATPDHLVISQVYGGGGNSGSTTGTATYKSDFVEIFNPTANAVSLSGWSVQYGSASSTANWSGNAPLSGTIGAGKYLLIKLQGGTNGADLPTPDIDSTVSGGGSFNMSGTTGKVALTTSSTILSGANPVSAAIVDMIGFGTANGAEGTVATAPSGITTNTTAMFRVDAGCTDTNNNSLDFTVAAVAPRNSATAANTCGAAPVAAKIVPTCPATITAVAGSGGSGALSAVDADSIVNSAVISSGASAGISLGAFTNSPAAGQAGTVSLNVGTGVAVGSYPIDITFGNDGAQTATCSTTVNVQALNAVTNTIMQIQGSGATSPFNNSVQTTEGVVTVKTTNGFFLQDATGDNDSSTSDAIFVFGTPTSYAPGDVVRVTGTVTEFTPSGGNHSITEFKNVTQIAKTGTGSVIPVEVAAPAADLSRYESMLVHVSNTLTVNDTSSIATFGELDLSSGRREVPTNHYPAGSSQALALAAANAANLIILGNGGVSNPIPYIGEGQTVRVGDTVTDIVGALDYGSIGNARSAYKLLPATAPVFSRSNARLDAPSIVPGNVKVASANVLNFFTTFTNGSDVSGATGQGCTVGATTDKSNCRGADNLVEFNRQLAKIVNELKAIDADVVGLMEIQNNGETAVSYLVNQLNAAIGSTTYAYVPKPAATGTDAIRVAMIYKPAKLTLVGGALSDDDAVNNRPPMAQAFVAGNGAKFSVIVNHLKSKGGCPKATDDDAPGNLDSGDSQGCWNAVRVLQAKRLASYFIPAVINAAGDPDVLVIGDMNSHGFEDPINTLTASGLVNELERFVRPNGMVYSYVFDGESGYLDHSLATASLDKQMAGATEWHNNADEPEVIDYNTDGKSQDLYVNNAFRASDHDPVVISLNLAAPPVVVTDSFSIYRSGFVLNRTTGQFSGTYNFTNKTAAAINGPFQVEFAGLPAGVTLANATGTHNGVPYITATAGTVAPGATVSVTTTFNNPNKVAINYTATIYSGNF